MAGMTFERIEKKYIIPPEKWDAFFSEFSKHFKIDQYGHHTICNIYFDNAHNDLIVRSLEKPVYKEKLRIRSYGIPGKEDTVYLEIKKKYKGVVYKRRIGMPLKDAEAYIFDGICPEFTDYEKDRIFKEIDYMIHFYGLQPSLYLAYNREAYFCPANERFRVTFDTDIRSRHEDFDLSSGDAGELLLPPGYRLMEVKAIDTLPLWFARLLSELEIYSVSFSKFGNIYTKDNGGELYVL